MEYTSAVLGIEPRHTHIVMEKNPVQKVLHDCVLVLHDIRSVHNVGSLFRTADGAGVSCIILSGYTPGPIDRFGASRKDLCKVSLGAEKSVPWERRDTIEEAVAALKADGYLIVAIEQHADSKPLLEWQPPAGARLAILLGNEVLGVTPHMLRASDVILEIPMRGEKNSLNVAVSGGIAMFALLR